jgi:hypothetical protein
MGGGMMGALRRAHKRLASRLIGWLIQRYRWHNCVLDTRIPNVGCLHVKSIVVVNGYGQERSYQFEVPS